MNAETVLVPPTVAPLDAPLPVHKFLPRFNQFSAQEQASRARHGLV